MHVVVVNCGEWDRCKIVGSYILYSKAEEIANKINATHMTARIEELKRESEIGPVVEIFMRKVIKTPTEVKTYEDRNWSYKTIEMLEDEPRPAQIEQCGYTRDGNLYMLWAYSTAELDTLMKGIK